MSDSDASTSTLPKGKNRQVILHFNGYEIRERIKSNCVAQLAESVKIYSELKGATPNAEELLLDTAAKLNYLNRLVSHCGLVSMGTLYEFIVEKCEDGGSPFESVGELEFFVRQYDPIIKFMPDLNYLQAPTTAFLTFVQFVASTLKSGQPVNEKNINQLITQHLNKGIGQTKNKETFHADAFYLDFSGLRNLGASIPWFTYDEKSKSVFLTPDHANGLALWLPVLIPLLNPDEPRHDNSHPMVFGAVVLKCSSTFKKSRIHGVGELSGYMCHTETDDDASDIDASKETYPAKTYVSVCAIPTWNEASQFKSTFIRESPIGVPKDDLPVKNKFWGDGNSNKRLLPKFGRPDEDWDLVKEKEEEKPATDERSVENSLASKPNVAVDCTVTHLMHQHEESETIKQLLELLERHKILSLNLIAKMYFSQGESQNEAYYADREKVEKRKKQQKKEYRRTMQCFDPAEGLILERGDRFLKDAEEVAQFIARHPEHFHILNGSVSAVAGSIQQAADALRYMLFYHAKPISLTEIKEKLKDQAWRAPHLVKCAESNKLEEFCDTLKFLKKSVHENDVIYTLDRHMAFPNSC